MANRIRATPTIDDRTAIKILIGNLTPAAGVLAADSVDEGADTEDAVGLRFIDVVVESIPNLITKLVQKIFRVLWIHVYTYLCCDVDFDTNLAVAFTQQFSLAVKMHSTSSLFPPDITTSPSSSLATE